MLKQLLLSLVLLAVPLDGKTVQLGVWEETASFRISGAHAEAEFGKSIQKVAVLETPKEEKSHTPLTKKEEYPLKCPCSIHLPAACCVQEPNLCPPKRPCCSDLGFGAGALFLATAAAGMLIPDCKTDPDPNGPQTLQFNVVLGCEIGAPVTASIYLPGMVFLESFSIELQTDNFSSVINNPASGNYTIVLEDVEEAPCFTATVILNGVNVVSGAPFTGTAPTITFSYTF